MNGKNKKLLWFEAGILIIILMTFSVCSSANEENFLKYPPAQPTDTPYINISGEYDTYEDGVFYLKAQIYYGTPPYNVSIIYGDGTYENKTSSDGEIVIFHQYETCREKPYRLHVFANDTHGDGAIAEANVYYKCCSFDLTCEIWEYKSAEKSYNCEGDLILFIVKVVSLPGSDYCTCENFIVYLNISWCNGGGNSSIPVSGGPISPGNYQLIPISCCQSCGPGQHTAKATVVTSPIEKNLDYNSAGTPFSIFSGSMCHFFDSFPDIFWRILGLIFGHNNYV